MIGSPSAGLSRLLRRKHQLARFLDGFLRKRHMHSHLVAVEVGVEGGGHQRVKLDGAAFDQDRLKSLDAQAVQGRGTVEQNRAFLDHLFEHFPDLGAVALDEALGAFDVGSIVVRHQAGDDKRAVKLQSHASWADRTGTA